mmetsp:Transcript_12456/g.19196  ORF Transcript_12456/g.19196 Transcript_12456/m.19196 type:complete len:297 (-) Transcript_12456:222-1112(-)|eukprot:CAMPEP_0178909328 /NCGR_PEP_ID=MMETSP0786-20121207/8445_1 /TAXON_ID=186022 /ORGANISM="Thalassionema frauenfeldii, Strain CCMP 1798" /LENGTH=296 /DNA_ID=CAMNT_0020581385 /DNA_START=116 /DNA_END=1006 /DNA_ORIENTATION=+
MDDDNLSESVQEMTEEEEQEIYRIRSKKSQNEMPRRNLLQRIASMGTINSTNSNRDEDIIGNTSLKNMPMARLESSYKHLEEEYCRLKFEQTELIALADQRKLQKSKSADLMQSLETEVRERTVENAKSREKLLNLKDKMKDMPKVFESKQEQRTLKSLLNSLWLKKDLESLRLSKIKEILKNLRKELEEDLLPKLEKRPDASHRSVLRELERRDRQHYIDDLIDTKNELLNEVGDLRASLYEEEIADQQSYRSKSFLKNDRVIGKEILLDEDSSTKEETETNSSSLQSFGSLRGH